MIKVTIPNVKLSQFTKSALVKKEDLFIVSKYVKNANVSIGDSQYDTKTEDLNTMSKTVLCALQHRGEYSKSPVEPYGTWTFTRELDVPTNSPEDTKPTDSINLDYCYENYLKRVEELSNNLFGTTGQLLPSYVGMIVISDKDPDDISALYGEGTVWKTIGGRFLLGVGDCGDNTFDDFGTLSPGEYIKNKNAGSMGGELSAQLTIKNIPAHRHCFNGAGGEKKQGKGKVPDLDCDLHMDKFPFFFCEFPMTVVEGEIHAGVRAHHSKHHKTHHSAWAHVGATLAALGVGVAYEHLSGGLHHRDTKMLIGDGAVGNTLPTESTEKSYSFTVHGEVDYNSGAAEPWHNNMMPYVVKYIYERKA